MNEEPDDAYMIAAASPETKEVDYLEGMTSEMFGDDNDFEVCVSELYKEQEEIEALPDAHYGLLGSSKDLLQPQGCMEDLPEEVLRQVLCLLPAQDLYRNTRLVCHRWKNIVDDTKFVPFKKKYFRYMMLEKDTVLEVLAVLRSSGIKGPTSSQHSMRHLVFHMVQHPIGERVHPVDILKCVEKHRLFPQAEASIRLRIPQVGKFMGIEGPHPLAAMAVILILSESVADVQALVLLLSDCMSYTAIKEYLSHIAMMFLAVERSHIQISDRAHYNIYYVLHLMENGPFSVNSGQTRGRDIHLTREQRQILSHDIQEDHVVKIIAFAGTGKTTTLIKYAEQRPYLRFLYVAFNRSVAEEAFQRFPHNVDCKTIHSLAYKDIGWRYQRKQKLTSTLTPWSISSCLPEGRGGFLKAKVVVSTLQSFMASNDPTISSIHVPSTYFSHRGHRTDIDENEKLLVVQDAQMIWSRMKDVNDKSKPAYFINHDGYLKLWQLRNPLPCLSAKYDALFIDEAQDCTPAIMDVLLSQRCGKILVGDPHQQIYTFRGAVNALQIVDHTHIYYLTQSFRFGAEIAYVGATILKVCKKVEKILVGGKQKGGVCDKAADEALAAVKAGRTVGQGKMAILSRCNVSVFSEAVRLTDINPQCRIHFIGGVNNIGLNKIQDIWLLMNSGPHQQQFIRDHLIGCFARMKGNGYGALKNYAMQTEDRDLETKLSIVEKYGNRIPDLVKRLELCSIDDLNQADFILGTVHKSKGLEFDTVMVTDDFANVPSSRHNLDDADPNFAFDEIPDDEWNLLYVAVTRTKNVLIITNNIRRIITMAGEYYLTSQMPSAPLKASNTLPCSIANCPNCITPGSAFIMSRRKMQCTDSVHAGGPLCERCVWTRIGSTAYLMTDDVLSMAAIPPRLDPLVHHGIFHAMF
ncbi:F-box DNA helicase 1 [Aulostomus maculatus]